MSLMAEEKKTVTAVQGPRENKEALEMQREVQDLTRKVESLTRRAQEEKKPLDAETIAQISRHLPKLIQKTLQKIEASAIFRTFKLAGRDWVVVDRREEKVAAKEGQEGKEAKPDEAKKIKEESKKPIEEMILMRGKLSPAREKEYENYLADPSLRLRMPEQKAAEDRLLKLLTKFEKLLLKRFEGGEEVAAPKREGEASFLKKTVEQWRQFFSRFVNRTVLRTVSAEQLHEGLFRGLVQRQARSTVISDLALVNGQVEKFARIHLQTPEQQIQAFLQKLEPGSKLSKEELKRLAAGDLEYLAIKEMEGEIAWARAPQKGKFFETAQTEALISQDLGIQLGDQLREKEKLIREAAARKRGGGKGGIGGEFFGEAAPGEESGPKEQFIPWWQYGPKKPIVRWGLAAFLFLLFLGILIGLTALF